MSVLLVFLKGREIKIDLYIKIYSARVIFRTYVVNIPYTLFLARSAYIYLDLRLVHFLGGLYKDDDMMGKQMRDEIYLIQGNLFAQNNKEKKKEEEEKPNLKRRKMNLTRPIIFTKTTFFA